MKSLSLSNLGLGILFLGLAGYGVYNINLKKEVKKAQSGDCGCNKSKKLVKEEVAEPANHNQPDITLFTSIRFLTRMVIKPKI